MTTIMKGKIGPSTAQMEKKKKAGKKPSSPQLPRPIRGRTNQKAPPPPGVSWKAPALRKGGIDWLVNSGFLRSQALEGWRPAERDAWPMEKEENEIPMFSHFCERGLALPSSDFFRGLLEFYKIEHVHCDSPT